MYVCMYYLKLGEVREVWRTLEGSRDVWQSVTGEGRSKLVQISVTYFMDGPSSDIYTSPLVIPIYCHVFFYFIRTLNVELYRRFILCLRQRWLQKFELFRRREEFTSDLCSTNSPRIWNPGNMWPTTSWLSSKNSGPKIRKRGQEHELLWRQLQRSIHSSTSSDPDRGLVIAFSCLLYCRGAKEVILWSHPASSCYELNRLRMH